MSTVSINDIERDLVGCLRRVKDGEVLVITENEQPIAELKPLSSAHNELRPVGLCAGQFQVPDDFNDPLPEEILRAFGN